MADAATGLLLSFARVLAIRAGVAIFNRYGENEAIRRALGPEEVVLSEDCIRQIVAAVTSVIKADLQEQLFAERLSRAQSDLNTIRDFLTDTYSTVAGNAADRNNSLDLYEFSLRSNVLGVLSSGDLTAKLVCLPAWMVAAAIHLAILQERANLQPDAGWGTVLRDIAKRYINYAERTYRDGFEFRMNQISDVTQETGSRLSTLDPLRLFSSNGRYYFTDTAELDSQQQLVKYYSFHERGVSTRAYEADTVRHHYLAEVKRLFEVSLSRAAMVETFQTWEGEIPGVSASLFRPMPPQGERPYAYIQLDAVRFDVAPAHPELLLSGQIFSYCGEGALRSNMGFGLKIIGAGRHLIPAPYSVVGSTLQFRRSFWIPCELSKQNEDVGWHFNLKLYRWSANDSRWLLLGDSGAGTPYHNVAGTIVAGRLVATENPVEMELKSFGYRSSRVGMLHYTAAKIHYFRAKRRS